MPGAFPVAEVSEFDTSLGMRLDYEACLAYVAFPPVGAIVLLILERNSDYVRYGKLNYGSSRRAKHLLVFKLLIFQLGFMLGNRHYYSQPSWSFI